jgi:hypothetical protein
MKVKMIEVEGWGLYEVPVGWWLYEIPEGVSLRELPAPILILDKNKNGFSLVSMVLVASKASISFGKPVLSRSMDPSEWEWE